MRPDLDAYYLIDQYLENNLQGEELAAFENKMKADLSFANQVQEQQMLNAFILEAELKDVRDRIEQDLSRIQQPSFFRTHWKWIGVGILSISWILYFGISSKENTNKVLQQSTSQSIEHTETAVSEKNKITVNPTKISSNAKSNTYSHDNVSGIETKTSTTTTIIDSIQIVKKIETITPFINPIDANHNPQIEARTTEETKKTDCSSIKITFSITTDMSCKNDETGSIYIEKISGGMAPYSYTLNNKKIKEKNIPDLAAGIYEVKISDKNGCSAEHKATVLEKNCTPAIQQGAKFNINPMIGETCSIPFNTDKKGSITIYSRSGKIIYRATNPSSDFVEWAGTDGYGALAEAGLYVYLIEYTDGTNVTGEVNIIR